jgi:hypothetical protein
MVCKLFQNNKGHVIFDNVIPPLSTFAFYENLGSHFIEFFSTLRIKPFSMVLSLAF